jgi:hypothetical protein
MTETIKFKGRVRQETFKHIIHEILYNGHKAVWREGNVTYWTGKNLFLARPHGVKYWDISIILGHKI